MTLTHKTLKMFWERVIKSEHQDDCWRWSGAKKPKGYGSLCIREEGKLTTHSAHRLSYLIHTGEIAGELHVLHRCDNPECTNPKHLRLGTNAENNKDMNAKGRAVYVSGSAHGNTSLSEADALFILLHKGKMQAKTLSAMFKITEHTVKNIWAGRTWKHLKR